MPDKIPDIKIEPCSDCSIPPRFVINPLPPTSDGKPRYDVECRNCEDRWIEILDD